MTTAYSGCPIPGKHRWPASNWRWSWTASSSWTAADSGHSPGSGPLGYSPEIWTRTQGHKIRIQSLGSHINSHCRSLGWTTIVTSIALTDWVPELDSCAPICLPTPGTSLTLLLPIGSDTKLPCFLLELDILADIPSMRLLSIKDWLECRPLAISTFLDASDIVLDGCVYNGTLYRSAERFDFNELKKLLNCNTVIFYI